MQADRQTGRQMTCSQTDPENNGKDRWSEQTRARAYYQGIAGLLATCQAKNEGTRKSKEILGDRPFVSYSKRQANLIAKILNHSPFRSMLHDGQARRSLKIDGASFVSYSFARQSQERVVLISIRDGGV